VEEFALLEKAIADWITMHLTIFILIGVGLVLTVLSRGVQLRLFPEMISVLLEKQEGRGQEFKMNIKGKEVVDLEWGGKLVFINSVVGGAIDSRFMPAILKGIMDCMERGPLTGSYARDVRVVVTMVRCTQ